MIMIANDQFLIELESIGEGYWGDYNATKSEDRELLRFYVSYLSDNEVIPVQDGSYCTLLTVEGATDPRLLAAAYLILQAATYPPGGSIVQSLQRASWMTWESVDEVILQDLQTSIDNEGGIEYEFG